MNGFIVSSDALKSALKHLAVSVPANPVLPALSCVMVASGSGSVELTTTNLELTITQSVLAEVKGEFKFLVPFEFLSKIVAVTPTQPISFKATAKTLTCTTDDDTFLQDLSMEADQFPKSPSIPKKAESLQFTHDDIKFMVAAKESAASDDLRPALSAVCLELGKQDSYVVSTDAHLLYRRRISHTVQEPVKLLVVTKAIAAIKTMESATVSWSDKHIRFHYAGLTVFSRLVDGAYPDYRVVIPSPAPNIRIDRLQTIDRLTRALAFTSSESNAVVVKLAEGEKRAIVKFENLDKGRSGETALPLIENQSTVPAFSVNAKKMITVLSQAAGADEVYLHLRDKNKAILVTGADDEDYTGLIMPMVMN